MGWDVAAGHGLAAGFKGSVVDTMVTGLDEALDQDRSIELLAALLVEQGHCDVKTVERGRRVTADSGQRLDTVLLQLGLVSERGLAEAYAALLGTRIATPDRYPEAEPLYPERLTARFLRTARAMPVAIEHEMLVVAAGRSARHLHPRRHRRRHRPARCGSRSPCRSSSRRRSTGSTARTQRAPRPRAVRRGRRAAGGGCRAAEGPGQRGAGRSGWSTRSSARAVETQASRHPYRAVRGPAARALPL